MRVALAQINPVMGDIAGNTKTIIDYILRSHEKHCGLVVFPELSILGYNPNDLLERPEVIAECKAAIAKIKKVIPKKMTVIVGGITVSPKKTTKPYYNSAIVLGATKAVVSKTLLPSYDVFDDQRFFSPGEPTQHLVRIGQKNVLILVCEDIWSWERTEHQHFMSLYKKKKIDLVVSINGSPFAPTKVKRRRSVVVKTAKYFKAPVVYVNCVGAQDEVIYDGGSMAVDSTGRSLAQSAYFTEDLNVLDLDKKLGGQRGRPDGPLQNLRQALILGIRDFANKNNLKKIHLGVSGGIDSALVLALAADALGPQNVTGIAMPGPFSSAESLRDAEKLCKNMGVSFFKMGIQESYEQLLAQFQSVFGEHPFGVLNENLQARLRGVYLMMYSNLQNSLLLTTGNKSELATGYSTLYGDMCGGLAPIGDLLKKQVYELAELYNAEHELIPRHILERPPSAELRPDQKDQDSLPQYNELDAAVEALVAQGRAAQSSTEKWLLKKMAMNEFKRWQAPPILRVSGHAFGRGRRLPITNRFYK